MKLKSSLVLGLAAFVLVGGSGCHFFRKSKKPKDPAIAADVETNFRQRWVERRTAELTAQGTEALAARQQAEAEFHEKFPYLKEGKK